MGHQDVQERQKSLNDAVIPVLHIRGISCNFHPYLNKMYLFVRSYRVRLLADEEMKFAYCYQQGFAKHSQVIVNVLWFQYPVSLLRQVWSLPAFHLWIWQTTFKDGFCYILA